MYAWIVADVDDDALDDVRDLVGGALGDADGRGFGVDVQGEMDHHGAEVERADVRRLSPTRPRTGGTRFSI